MRGFTVKGGQHGIMMQPGQHDIVIEQNDVSGWGTFRTTNVRQAPVVGGPAARRLRNLFMTLPSEA